MSAVGTGCDTAGDGTGVDVADSVSLGAIAAGGCVVELDGGVLGGVEVPAGAASDCVDELAGAFDAPGTAAGAMRCLAPRPSMLPVA